MTTLTGGLSMFDVFIHVVSEKHNDHISMSSEHA